MLVVSPPSYLELKFSLIGNEFPRCYSSRIPKARCCLGLGDSGKTYSEAPSSRGIPVHLLPSRRAVVGDSAEVDRKHWSRRLAKRSPVCAGSDWQQLPGIGPWESFRSTHSICGKVCHCGQVTSARDMQGKWQRVGQWYSTSSHACPTIYLLKNS